MKIVLLLIYCLLILHRVYMESEINDHIFLSCCFHLVILIPSTRKTFYEIVQTRLTKSI